MHYQVQHFPLKVAKYFVVGGVAASVDLAIFATLVKGLHVIWPIAATLSFVVATGVNYFLSIRFVFASGQRFRPINEVILVFVLSALGLIFNQCILYLLIEICAIELILAKILATGLVFFFNYGIRRYFIFA